MEPLTDAVWREAMPLLRAHWAEVSHFHDIPLEPDESLYAATQAAGFLRFYSARDTEGSLQGYALFFVRANPHYRSSVQASNDVVFLSKSMRGMAGWKFLKWCDATLAAEGVDAIYWHIKALHDFGLILERMGYALVDQIYARRVAHAPAQADGHAALDAVFA
jgi:hypothetical protein